MRRREWLGVWLRRPWDLVRWARTRLGVKGKTLWDWLDLLIVPAILILIGLAWNVAQTSRDREREEQRIEADQAAAEEVRQDATLEAYLDQMSGLMLESKLLTSDKQSPVRTVARTVTLTALRHLNGERKADVIRFLYEARLLSTRPPRVQLNAANLEDVKLGKANLGDANLEGADLPGANLGGASLREAKLAHANLTGSDLGHANLGGADLTRANLGGADLPGADLRGANLTGVNLRGVDLTRAVLSSANLIGADLRLARLDGANLQGANLPGANLQDAALGEAELQGAAIGEANLRRAYLGEANLRGAYLRNANLASADFKDADLERVNLVGAELRGATGLNLQRFITDLFQEEREEFLDSQEQFLDSLSPAELAKFNLTPEKLEKFRREANGG